MNSKIRIKYTGLALVVMALVSASVLLSGCGEAVQFFLNGQPANSSSSVSSASSSVSSVVPSFVPTVWTDVTNNPLFGGSSGTTKAYYPSVVKAGSTYHVWYGDGTRVRHATSVYPDFHDISPYPANEVTVGGVLMSTALTTPYHPSVLYNSSGWTINGAATANSFLMYIAPSTWNSILVLTSADGMDWTNLGTCTGIMTYPAQTGVIYNFAVIYEGGTNWKGYADNGASHIQYFVSSNGFDWVGQASDILSNTYNSWEWVSNQIRPWVIKTGSTYVMFYSSGWTMNDNALGYATSADGMTFIKPVNNMIFSTNDGLSWRVIRSYAAFVIADGAIWRMYYTGRDAAGVYSVGTATSTN